MFRPLELPVAGLVPWAFSPRTGSVGIHDFFLLGGGSGEDVGGRTKSGHGAYWIATSGR
jgi:hypothetical protein